MAMIQDKSPDIIYHYTDGAGLVGIMKDQTLWATDYRYLNDYSELKVFNEYLLGRLEKLSYNQQIKTEINYLISVALPKVVDSLADNPHDPKIFVTSFCVNDDLLSQWRGYGFDDSYAIGFDYNGLNVMRTAEHYKRKFVMSLFNAVVYNNDSIPESFVNTIDELIDKLVDFHTKQQEERLETLTKYIETLPLFKHKGFFEEREYRLVFTTNLSQMSDIKFRYQSGSVVPYIVLFEGEQRSLPIKDIVVGPSQSAERRRQSIQSMLAQKGFDPKIVRLSSIPYVR